jgi:hypothetical protein
MGSNELQSNDKLGGLLVQLGAATMIGCGNRHEPVILWQDGERNVQGEKSEDILVRYVCSLIDEVSFSLQATNVRILPLVQRRSTNKRLPLLRLS